MNERNRSTPSPELVLGATVVVATGSAGLLTVLLPALLEPLGVDAVAGVLLVGAISPFLHALLPLGFVYAACERIGGLPLSTRTVAAVSLPAAVFGRYVGTGAGYVLLGRGLPSPFVLVTAGDLAVREFGPVTWVVVAVGVLGAGLWGAVGALGGVGAVRHSVDSA